MSSRAPEERIGTVVADRYRIDEVIGVGGMGVVFGATHTWTDRRVALKILRSHLVDDADAVRRFLLEAKSAAALRHPNVVDVLDMGRSDDGMVFIALERLEGSSLADRLLARGAPFGFEETSALLLPVLDALGAAHEAGVVHRDVKPDNIFLATAPNGEVVPKLVDFGLAKLQRGPDRRETGTGVLIGTPEYMSPEQAMGTREVGPESDVWSMAIVFYECLTGETPFHHESVAYTLVRLLGDPLPSFGDLSPALPPGAVPVLDRAIRRPAGERFGSASEFARALREAISGEDRIGRSHPLADTVPPPPMDAPEPAPVVELPRDRVPSFLANASTPSPSSTPARGPSVPKSGSFRAVTAVRPYGPRIRTKVFPLLEAAGMRVDPADVVPAGTSDDETVERVMASPIPLLLVPFHGHVDAQGNRVDGLAIVRRLFALDPNFPWVVIMPVSNFASAALTLALESQGAQRIPEIVRRRMIVLTEDDLDARDTASRLRAQVATALVA